MPPFPLLGRVYSALVADSLPAEGQAGSLPYEGSSALVKWCGGFDAPLPASPVSWGPSMKKRKPGQNANPPQSSNSPQPGSSPSRLTLLWELLAVLAVGVGVWFWRQSGKRAEEAAQPDSTLAATTTPAAIPKSEQVQSQKGPAVPPPTRQPGTPPNSNDSGGTFLEGFGKKADPENDFAGPLATNAELEKSFQAILNDRIPLKGQQLSAAEKKRIEDRLNRALASFEKDLKRARIARPKAAVPEWLTGELLLLIGGHPKDEILPHLRLAVERGLTRPRLFASLARAQTEANQFEQAFQSASKALDLDGKDRYGWNAYTRAAIHLQRFAELAKRLEQTFPDARPNWAAEMHRAAQTWQKRWQVEQKLRQVDAGANLPRLRFFIEHRRFARDANGAALTTIESTGKGEVILELFEDQAPEAVANFLTLVEQKVYDGTRFYLAVPAALVAGGDPKSKTRDPKDDGTGNPGYFIPDEFNRPDARGHFRGSISLVNSGPKTTGCQFFINLVPSQEMDGHFTVFGRVLKGQEVIDRITPGRTNAQVGGGRGRIVPGDLLIRAEILRKRPHKYRVTKLTQE